MTFILYCDRDPRELKIEDEQGKCDLVKLKEHIDTCSPCKEFLVLLGKDFLDTMIEAFGRRWKVKKD